MADVNPEGVGRQGDGGKHACPAKYILGQLVARTFVEPFALTVPHFPDVKHIYRSTEQWKGLSPRYNNMQVVTA